MLDKSITCFPEQDTFVNSREAHDQGFCPSSTRPADVPARSHTGSPIFGVMESMGDVVNLNRFRKRAERGRQDKVAETNRARHGRTKSERERDEALAKRTQDFLDGHHVDGKDAP